MPSHRQRACATVDLQQPEAGAWRRVSLNGQEVVPLLLIRSKRKGSQQGLSFGGQEVLLQTAIGFVGESPFNQPTIQHLANPQIEFP